MASDGPRPAALRLRPAADGALGLLPARPKTLLQLKPEPARPPLLRYFTFLRSMHRAPRLASTLRSSARLAAPALRLPLAARPLARTLHTSPTARMLIEQTTLSSASAEPPREPTANEEKARQIARDFRT